MAQDKDFYTMKSLPKRERPIDKVLSSTSLHLSIWQPIVDEIDKDHNNDLERASLYPRESTPLIY